MSKKFCDLDDAIKGAVEVLEEVENFRSDIQIDVENLIDYVEQFDDESEKADLLKAVEAIREELDCLLTKLK